MPTDVHDHDDPPCECSHVKSRHPYGGRCNRADCVCRRMRAKAVVVAGPPLDPPPEPAAALPPAAVEDPAPPPAEEPDPPPVEPEPEPEQPEDSSRPSRMEVLQSALRHEAQAIRAQANKIVKAFDELDELLANIETRRELEQQLREAEARVEELRRQLGIRKPGRPKAP